MSRAAMKTSLASFALLLFVAACSGPSGGVPQPSSSSSGEPVGLAATAAECDALGTVFCQKLFACNIVAGQMLGSACADRYASSCKARITAPSTGLTQTALATCQQAFTAATCDAAFGSTPPPGCDFKGGLAIDAQCAFDEQCASGDCSATSTSCGKCVAATLKPPPPPPPQANLGETCDGAGVSAPRCNNAKGLSCDSTKKCAAIELAAIGQPCGFVGESLAKVECLAGGRCAYGAKNSGSCTAEVPVGGACAKAEECAFATTCFGGKCGFPTASDLCQ